MRTKSVGYFLNLFVVMALLAITATANASSVYSEGNGNNASTSGLGVCQLIYASSYQPAFNSSPDGYGYAGSCTIVQNGTRSGGILAVYVRDCSAAFSSSQSAACVPPPACPPAGTVSPSSENFTTGYSPSMNGVSTVGVVPNGQWTSTDAQGCVITVTAGAGPVACYSSQTPSSNGLYRYSCDFSATFSGQLSSLGPNANAAPPKCPGSSGVVNGVPVCLVGTSSSSSGSELPPLAGNPPPGTSPSADVPAPYPATAPSNPGSAVGSGSGGGSGGATGGGGGSNGNPTDAPRSNTPSGSTGNANNPLPPKPPGPVECGGPGRPACKIDESGTPSATGAFDGAGKALSDVTRSSTDQINNAASAAGKDTSWHFSFNLPSQCSVFPMFMGVQINFCSFQPMVHDLMSLVWVSTTIFVLIGMFGRAQRGTA